MSMNDEEGLNRGLGIPTRHIFLDTEVYRKNNFNLYNALFSRLRDHIHINGIVLHMTEITYREIYKELGNIIEKDTGEYEKVAKRIAKWNEFGVKIKPDLEMKRDVSEAKLKCQSIYNHILFNVFRAKKHKLDDLQIEKIINAYFLEKPPFHEPKKPKEFPDALTIDILTRWCNSRNRTMIVVSDDKGLRDAAEAAGCFYTLRTLNEYLEKIVEAEHPDVQRIANRVVSKISLHGHTEQVLAALVERVDIIYSGMLPDGEVTSIEVKSGIEFSGDPEVLFCDISRLDFVIEICVPFRYDISFYDTSSGMYDSEDKVFIGGHYSQAEREDEMVVRAFFSYDRENESLLTAGLLTQEIVINDSLEDI